MNVIIADDHDVMREGIRSVLAKRFPALTVSEAQNSQQVIDLVRQEKTDLIILDINMPGRSGLDILKEVKRENPKLPVLILSMYPEDQFAVRAIKAGAAGYLTKANAAKEMISAVQTVLKGTRYISPTLALKLADAIGNPDESKLHETLSDREYQVFQKIASGKTVGEIANELCLSVKTISTFRANILRKMGVRNNAEIVQHAVRNSLVD